MAWENPVTTWGQAGKTVPGADDFNRIEKNAKHIFDMIGAVNGIATLDAGGKVPQAQLPTSVEIASLNISQSLAAGANVSKSFTFTNKHDAVLFIAKNGPYRYGAIGIVTDITFPYPGGGTSDYISMYLARDGSGVTSMSCKKGVFGSSSDNEVGYAVTYNDKVITFELKNHGATTQTATADFILIGL